jgi:hypothetical protein
VAPVELHVSDVDPPEATAEEFDDRSTVGAGGVLAISRP